MLSEDQELSEGVEEVQKQVYRRRVPLSQNGGWLNFGVGGGRSVEITGRANKRRDRATRDSTAHRKSPQTNDRRRSDLTIAELLPLRTTKISDEVRVVDLVTVVYFP